MKGRLSGWVVFSCQTRHWWVKVPPPGPLGPGYHPLPPTPAPLPPPNSSRAREMAAGMNGTRFIHRWNGDAGLPPGGGDFNERTQKRADFWWVSIALYLISYETMWVCFQSKKQIKDPILEKWEMNQKEKKSGVKMDQGNGNDGQWQA